jgi:uncharacterized protein YoxC
MMDLIARSGAWLQLQAATLPDTLVMKTVTAERGWFETVTGIASSIMTLTLVVLAVFLAPAAWSFWRTFRKVRTIIDRVYADITPITHHASSIADNLDYITTSIRTDVQQVNATIASANRRLHQAVELTETRLNEFNALLQVVQQEAEQAFVSTASAVRGVRTGAATLSGLNETFEEDGAGGEDDYGDDDDSDEDSDEISDSGRERIDTRGTARPRLRARRKRLD